MQHSGDKVFVANTYFFVLLLLTFTKKKMAVTMHFRILHFAFRKKSEGDGVARGGNKKVTTSAKCGCVSGCVFGCAADSECVISYELCGESAENLEVFRALFLFFVF